MILHCGLETIAATVYNYIFWSYHLANMDLIFAVSDVRAEAIASNTHCRLKRLITRNDFMVPIFLLINGV
jgi:hypothetical protein